MTTTEGTAHYSLWAVFRRVMGESAPAPRASTARDPLAEIETDGVTVRGFYDTSGLRADADAVVWLVGPSAEALQRSLRALRRRDEFRALAPTWNALGVHRDAEFTPDHAPAFARGLPPRGWLAVYPFVRSYDWYLLPEGERRQMLADHGRKGAEFSSVQTNTVAAFALGDYEWILALEADDPTELVDLVRHLRYTDARLHVREEVPFFTGRLVTLDEIAEIVR